MRVRLHLAHLLCAVLVACSGETSSLQIDSPDAAPPASVEVGEEPRHSDSMPSREESLRSFESFDELIWDFVHVAERIVVAGSASLLLSSGWSSEADRAMNAGEGGVWCAGAAEFLALQWAEIGTAVVHYGPHPAAGHPEGLLTHAVTLVHFEGDWYAVDPYLGVIYPDPAQDWVDQIPHSPVRQLSVPIQRRVIFELGHLERLKQGQVSWLVGRFDEVGDALDACQVAEAGVASCALWMDAQDLMNLHDKVGPSLDYVESLGFPRDLNSLMAFPYGLFDGSNWHWVSSWDDVWALLEAPE